MPPGSVALLHELDDRALAHAAADRRYPKWSTMCLLRQLGYPVLNACCIQPTDGALLREAVRRLSVAAGTDRLLLRSDGGVEATQYYRGGNTFPLGRLEPRAAALLHADRAVILTEPLNRGGIQPQLTVAVHDIDWARYRELWWSDLHVTVRMSPDAEQRRRHQRLLRLATDILPDTGHALPTGEPATAQAWVEARGYLGLWQPWDPMAVIRGIRRWYDDGFLLGSSLQTRDWRCLSLPLSSLGHGRTVYWDV